MNAVNDLIASIKELKPFSRVASQILTVSEDPDSSMNDIAEIIVYDPSITTTLIKRCNSAYYSLPRQVESVQDAITYIGLDEVVSLVLVDQCSGNFEKKQEGYGLTEGELWKHSVFSAIIAKKLAKVKNVENISLVFTAAMIKDIGKINLDSFVSGRYKKIKYLVNEKNYSFMEAEKKIIGVNHAELGAIIAKMWKFSPKMIFIIANHHMSSEKAKTDLDTAIVYIADIICNTMGVGCGIDGMSSRFHKDVMEFLNITPEDFEMVIAESYQEMEKVERLINAV